MENAGMQHKPPNEQQEVCAPLQQSDAPERVTCPVGREVNATALVHNAKQTGYSPSCAVPRGSNPLHFPTQRRRNAHAEAPSVQRSLHMPRSGTRQPRQEPAACRSRGCRGSADVAARSMCFNKSGQLQRGKRYRGTQPRRGKYGLRAGGCIVVSHHNFSLLELWAVRGGSHTLLPHRTLSVCFPLQHVRSQESLLQSQLASQPVVFPEIPIATVRRLRPFRFRHQKKIRQSF
jgi:hypothetical protein